MKTSITKSLVLPALLVVLCSRPVNAQSNSATAAGFHSGKPYPSIIFTDMDGSVYRSADLCQTWTTLQGGREGSFFSTNKARPIVVFTDMSGTVYQSFDGAKSFWKTSPESAVTTSNPRVSTDIRQFVVEPTVKVISVVPNPGRAQMTLTVSSTKEQHTRVILEDRLGSLVQVLKEGTLQAGETPIHFNVSRLPVGTYTYKILSGPDIVSGQIIVRTQR